MTSSIKGTKGPGPANAPTAHPAPPIRKAGPTPPVADVKVSKPAQMAPVAKSTPTTPVAQASAPVVAAPAAAAVAVASAPAAASIAVTKGSPLLHNVAGLPAGFDLSQINGVSWGASDGLTGSYIARPSSNSFVGYGDVMAPVATPNGFSIDVVLRSQNSTDREMLFLQLPLVDEKSGNLTYLNLDLLTYNAATKDFFDAITTTAATCPTSNRDCFVGRRTYHFSLAQINSFLKAQGIPVTVKPGDMLSISGLVEGSGHRIMNAASNAFTIPAPLAAKPQKAVAVRAAAQKTVGKGADLPLDIKVMLSKAVMDYEFTAIDPKTGEVGSFTVKDIIEGDVTSRLESEYKGSITAAQLDAMITRAYAFADLNEKAAGGDASARAQLDKDLAPGLAWEPVRRHWLTSDGTPVGERDYKILTIARDDKGRPKLDPMSDGYFDDQALTFTKMRGAIRVRSNNQKAGHAEFKLGGGELDPKTKIRQRVEYGVSLKPGVTTQMFMLLLKEIIKNPSSVLAQSPLGQIVREAQKLGLESELVSDQSLWAKVEQIRHKFEVQKVATGAKVESSLDNVHAETVRPEHEVDGWPQERRFGVIENELDHLQINTANTVSMDVSNKSSFTSADAQAKFVQDTKAAVKAGTVKLSVMRVPTLHSLDHVKDGSFRKTPSYADFEEINANILTGLLPDGTPGEAVQKAAHFARALGLIEEGKA